MIKIERIEAAVDCLEQGRILVFSDSSNIAYCSMIDKNRIRIFNVFSNLCISIDDFVVLYHHQVFYIYEKKCDQEVMSNEKDEEYYRWKNK